MKIYLDGEYCDKEDAKISVFDHGLLYGDGVFEGIRRGTIQAQPGRLLLERLLPESRPVRLDLPRIRSSHDRAIAEGKIMAALNAGQINPTEAHALQRVIAAAWQSLLQWRLDHDEPMA